MRLGAPAKDASGTAGERKTPKLATKKFEITQRRWENGVYLGNNKRLQGVWKKRGTRFETFRSRVPENKGTKITNKCLPSVRMGKGGKCDNPYLRDRFSVKYKVNYQ